MLGRRVAYDKDARRAEALARLLVLDTPEEQAFDDIVFIASQTCDAPIALISLLDTDRQWFKARVGLDVAETPIHQSVCRIDIDNPTVLEVVDLTADERTNDNQLVTGDHAFRYYAGAPLMLRSGEIVGRLCVIDTQARPGGLSDTQKTLLNALARQASDHLELRRIARGSERLAALQTALVQIGEAIRDSHDIAAMTRAASAIVGNVLQVSRAGFGSVDGEVRHIDVEPDWTASGVVSIEGRHRFEDFGRIRDDLLRGEPLVIENVLTDPRTIEASGAMTALGVTALVNMPVRQHGCTVAVLIVNAATRRIWQPEELTFLRSVADRLEAGVSRVRAELQQEMLNGEIAHRLKNMLSMVQAIASQTLRDIPDRRPVESFEQRLMALSAAHDVLLQKSWTDADLRVVAEAVVEATGFSNRVHIAGPEVALGSRAALSFSLIIHELMTNACKYGALCKPGGHVRITWLMEATEVGDELVVNWRETGGPPVIPPNRRGFGSKLVRLGLTGSGGVDLRFEPDGLQVDLRALMRQLAQA
jgi:two-component sensor histidine kinase